MRLGRVLVCLGCVRVCVCVAVWVCLSVFGCVWGAFGFVWGVFGCVWGVLGCVWGAFGCVWGAPGQQKTRIVLLRAIWHLKLASARLDSVGVLMKCLGGVVTGYVCGRVWACVGVTTLANHLGYVFATPAEVEVTEILGDFMAVT